MSKILGNKLPPAVKKLLNREAASVVLSTVTAGGWPHAMPVHLLCAPSEQIILISLMKAHQSTQNIRDNGKAMITILESDDIAVGIKGMAKITREPMHANKAMALIEFEIIEIKSDTTPTVVVTQGVQFKHRTEKTSAFFRSCFDELYAYGNI